MCKQPSKQQLYKMFRNVRTLAERVRACPGVSGRVRACPECPVGDWTCAHMVLSGLCPVVSGPCPVPVRSCPKMVSDPVRKAVRKAVRNVRECPKRCPDCPVGAQRPTEKDFVGDTLKVMGLGRVGGHRGRKSCRSIRQAGLSPLCWRQSLRAAVGVDGAMPSAMLPTSRFPVNPLVTLMSELLIARAPS